ASRDVGFPDEQVPFFIFGHGSPRSFQVSISRGPAILRAYDSSGLRFLIHVVPTAVNDEEIEVSVREHGGKREFVFSLHVRVPIGPVTALESIKTAFADAGGGP